ncbi:hypothetical protein Rsub_10782 [Raphidocelis subcapitata]|uniref:LITAF domain-containing protein n=1 Tax=Raphidocelis subcapitata TaxID=307507 RepID=A0A2V0PM04_9CHLO|nr:hypothetical protein Rsub_10782 [Raphidocelis subcapitata]|eukprot:GBF98387.1 hypothetical protein Rsub_10782 [Raphidocelis subcapitata]
MGAGGPLNQPLLAPADGGAPSAPPLLDASGAAYAPAAAPPGPAAGYPPYAQQQRGAAAPYAPPAVLGAPLYAQHPPLEAPIVQHTTTHIYDRPLIQNVSLAPVLQMCPSCGHTGATRVRRERGCCTWLAAFGLFWVCCPIFWLPCCIASCKDTVHRCKNCGTEVARIAPC